MHTLKFKIVAMAVAAALGATVLTAQLLLATTASKMEALLLEAERDEAESTAAILSTKVDMLRDALKASVRQVPPGDWSQPDVMAAQLKSKAALASLFDTVLAIDTKGDVIARIGQSTSSQNVLNVADRAYFRQALLTDQPIISEPIMARRLNVPVVIFAMSAVADDGRRLGVLAGSVALKSNGLFADRVAGGRQQGARVVVMTRTGLVLAHPDQQRLLGQAGDEPGLSAAVAQWRDSGSPIDTLGTAAIVQGQLVAMSGIPDTDWMLARVTSESAALAPVSDARRTASRVAASVALGVAAAAGLLAWSLTLPISRLKSRADSLMKTEDADWSGWRDHRGEVGQLAAAFQRVVQQRHQKQTETQALLHQLEAVLDHAEAGIALTRNGRFELVSTEFCAIMGYDKHTVIGQPTNLIHLSEEAYQAFSDRAQPAFMEKGSFEGEVELVRQNREVFWARMRGKAVVPGDRSQGTIWTFEDITAAREKQEKLLYTSNHDALTGLVNRAAFDGRLKQAMALKEGPPVCAMFIDLDRFKQVNDTGGHAAGDAMLQEVARILGAQVRQADTVARFGGDEFAVLLVGCPPPRAVEIGEKIRKAVEEGVVQWEGRAYRVGASIGLVVVDAQYLAAEDVLGAADAACYAAKRRGRNALVVHERSPAGAAGRGDQGEHVA